MFSRFGPPQPEEMLAVKVKNTTLHLNGQNLRLVAKNGRNAKTPSVHLSPTHGEEAVGCLPACSLTQKGTALLDLLFKPPWPDLQREAKNQRVRRHLMLKPLKLPKEVREAQRQKLKSIQTQAKAASCKMDVMLNEGHTRKIKAVVCPFASTEPLKTQNRSPRLRPARPNAVVQNGDCHQDVVCRGTPAPLFNRPAPPLPSLRVKARGGSAEVAQKDPFTVHQETRRRRLRLSRIQCLEEDECNPNTSTGGLSAEKGKLAQGVQAKGQLAKQAQRGQHHAGKGFIKPLAASRENENIRKCHQEDCNRLSARCTINRQLYGTGCSQRELDDAKPSAARLKRKKPFITKLNNAVLGECFQL